MFTKTHLGLRYASIGRFITGLKQSSEIYVKKKEKNKAEVTAHN